MSMYFFFFFSSRRRHTRSKRDWSSDVCSSDLWGSSPATSPTTNAPRPRPSCTWSGSTGIAMPVTRRSEERRVGKEGGSGGAPEREKKKESSGGKDGQGRGVVTERDRPAGVEQR